MLKNKKVANVPEAGTRGRGKKPGHKANKSQTMCDK